MLSAQGRLILVWRNAAALIHRVAHAGLRVVDRVRGIPDFPQLTHTTRSVSTVLIDAGFEIERAELSCPPLNWRSAAVDGVLGRIIGASCIIVACKRDA